MVRGRNRGGLRRYSEIQMQGLAFSDRNGGREYGYKAGGIV